MRSGQGVHGCQRVAKNLAATCGNSDLQDVVDAHVKARLHEVARFGGQQWRRGLACAARSNVLAENFIASNSLCVSSSVQSSTDTVIGSTAMGLVARSYPTSYSKPQRSSGSLGV